MKATDADVDHNTNGKISFSLRGHEDLFSIDSFNGSITRKRPLDCKKTIPQHLDIYVTASDNPSDPSMKRLELIFNITFVTYPASPGNIRNSFYIAF